MSFDLQLDTPRYQAKLAQTDEERVQAYRLRHKVFFESRGLPGVGPLAHEGLDFEPETDPQAEHLLILDQRTGEVVGNYRLIISSEQEPTHLYSSREFDLSHFFKNTSTPRLEVGRACIHPDHRRGAVIALIWRALAQVLKRTSSSLLMGCTSLPAPENAQIWHTLANTLTEHGILDLNYPISPYHPLPETLEHGAKTLEIPTLLKFYIKAGGQLLGQPAYDSEFQCIDCFTVLEMKNLAPEFRERYFA